MLERFAKLLPALIIGLNVIVFVPMTLWIFISDGGPMGFGYLGLPFTFLMNIGGVLSAVQLVRKSNRMSFLIINGIFAIVGICLTLLFVLDVWVSILEQVSTV
ncbi:MAG: hypothetical protein NWQ63_01095 [Schleiferiaceae bacterium]|jgi:hypothetical protein|nr:hypothetical protein [Schleiferiaceae bacterium]MDP4759471.1 hypothetical protein [Schleiferiaceae bacterium]MDP4767567.1 hypothetical protein [Schleiferiaceae bacterium]MDP4876636.1 hypothetical protein [Schleiferiaceae bacterium]MDP4958586.1 hypothetical protein [Schleiferiaceae bacterium]